MITLRMKEKKFQTMFEEEQFVISDVEGSEEEVIVIIFVCLLC